MCGQFKPCVQTVAPHSLLVRGYLTFYIGDRQGGSRTYTDEESFERIRFYEIIAGKWGK